MGLIRPDPTKLDFRFLYYYFFAPQWRAVVQQKTITGATVDRLPIKTFPDFEIELPPLPIQRRIADILSAYDDLIENNRRRIEILEEMARAMYSKEFPVGSGNDKHLTDIVEELESGGRPKGGALTEGVPSIGAEQIDGVGNYNYQAEKYVSDEYYQKMRRGKVLSGDVLLYKDGAYTGKVSMALNGFPHEKAAVNEHVFIMRSKYKFFLYCFMRQSETYSTINTLASAKACQPGLNQADVLGVEIEIPDEASLDGFERSVEPLFEQIVNLAKQNAKLAAARDLLLPRLMSGKLSVFAAEPLRRDEEVA